MSIRQEMVPVANISTNLGMWLVVGGLLVDFTGLAKIGVILLGGAVAAAVTAILQLLYLVFRVYGDR